MDLPSEVKVVGVDEKRVDQSPSPSDRWVAPNEWLLRFIDEYSGKHDGQSETLPAGCDPERAAAAVLSLNEDESVRILTELVETSQNDYTIDTNLLRRCAELAEGNIACGMEQGEWAYVTCKTAGLIHNWSPYAEVRAVTVPYDDPDEPCESIRAYAVGMFWVVVATAVNTCECSSIG